MKSAVLLVVALAVTVTLAACGGGDDFARATAAPSAPVATTAPAPTVPPRETPTQSIDWKPGLLDQLEAKVDVGGYGLAVGCAGTGTPTVVFESGAGTNKYNWRVVQSIVAGETRACSYTRAGMDKGKRTIGAVQSDSPSAEDVVFEDDNLIVTTAQSTIDDLSNLLRAAQIESPYVLVGHSLGGIYIRLFANQYPELVAGMVFVDSSHPSQGERYKGVMPEFFFEDAMTNALLELVTAAKDTGPFADLPIAVLSADPEVKISEFVNGGLSENTATAAIEIGSELQEDLARLSTDSTHQVVEGTGHFIHDDEAELVAETILDIVRKARSQ